MNLINFSILLALLLVGSTYSLVKKDCKCRPFVSKRIINGIVIDNSSYNWLVNIKSKLKNNLTVCQASILNENYLLTSATCVPTFESDLKYMKIEFRANKTLIDVENVIRHPNYKRGDFNSTDDIALVKIKGSIHFDAQTSPACLFNKDFNINKLTVAGHGSLTPVKVDGKSGNITGFRPSTKLRKGFVYDFTNNSDKCRADADKTICINNYQANPHFVCLGDQGAPLHNMLKGKDYVVGIIGALGAYQLPDKSYELCTRRATTKATRVSHYLNWIESHIGDQYCD